MRRKHKKALGGWGKKLFELRKKLELTQEELAQKIGCSYVTINRIENGHEPGKQTKKLIEIFINSVEKETTNE